MRFSWILALAVVCGGCNSAPSSEDGAASVAKGAAAPRTIVPKGSPSFSSKELGFAVWLPVNPQQRQQSQEINPGETVTAHFFQAGTDKVNYVVIAIPTTSSVDVSDPQGQLDTIEKSLIKTVVGKSPGANVQKREELRLDEFQGFELQMSLLKGAATTRARIFFTPKCVYQIIAGGKGEDVQKQAAQINSVFDSFRVLPG